jgi:hypothetical protein
VQLGIYQVAHLPNQITDLPLRSCAEAFIRHVDQFPEITGQIQRSSTGTGEDVPGMFVRNTRMLIAAVPTSYVIHIFLEGAIS